MISKYSLTIVLTGLVGLGLSAEPPNGSRQVQLGSIAGIVVSDENPERPVRRAVVVASGPALKTSRGAISDDEGRFRFDDLPAGSYSVIASRPTFVTSAYGALRPARPGTPVLVAANAPVTEIRLRLWRGAVIAGAVRNERGEPVEGLPVRALPLRSSAAKYLSLTNNGVVTDEEGRFRIFGLEPGQYIVSATPSFAGALASLALHDSYVDSVLNNLRGGGRGIPQRQSTASEPPPAILYSPVYYPGTPRVDEAAPITLTPGLTLEGLSLTLLQVPAVNVSGLVLMPDGTPAAGADVQLVGTQSSHRVLPPFEGRYGAIAGPAGSFLIPHVPPGAYEVFARVRVGRTSQSGTGTAPSGTLWGTGRLDMSGSVVTGLVIRVAAGLTVRGQVRVVDSAVVARPVLEDVRVAVIPATTAVPRTLRGSPTPPVTSDGRFAIVDLKPNTEYRLVIDGLPGGWWPESATLGGADLLDRPLTLSADRTQGPLSITVTNRVTKLVGTLQGPPLVGNVFIVIFPVNRSLWDSERRVRAVQPDASGAYEFVNLLPGDYLVGAVGDVDVDEWRDPAFLEKVAQVSVAVTMTRGETKRLALRTQ